MYDPNWQPSQFNFTPQSGVLNGTGLSQPAQGGWNKGNYYLGQLQNAPVSFSNNQQQSISNNQQQSMDPTGGMAMAGIGYGVQGAMSLYNMFSANRQMKRLGNRPTLTPPKELVEIQKKREEASNKFQGFSQEMLTDSRNRAKGETASILNRAQMTGAPQNLVYAGLNIGRNAADLNLGAKSSILDRDQRRIDQNAAESASMKIGDIDLQNQVADQQIYDQTLMALARQMQSGTQSVYNMSGALGTTGYGLAMNA